MLVYVVVLLIVHVPVHKRKLTAETVRLCFFTSKKDNNRCSAPQRTYQIDHAEFGSVNLFIKIRSVSQIELHLQWPTSRKSYNYGSSNGAVFSDFQ